MNREDWNRIRVKERMSTRLICVSPGDSVIEAVEKMTEEGIGRLFMSMFLFLPITNFICIPNLPYTLNRIALKIGDEVKEKWKYQLYRKKKNGR
ncbi:MAG: CBS domain-containing protein [Methanophagales archaeon]|nr:CBS domain-containing protein [Methanophagales archaeon]